MFYLHVSNRTENLINHLAAVVDADRSVSFFEQEIFLIQSRGMERMLSQNLAELFGCWCNFNYLLPLGFLDLIAERLGIGIAPDFFDREVLTWRLEKLLRQLDHPVYDPLQKYLQGENKALKRYQLARKLANVFDQYQMMRPDMLRSWDQGKTVSNHSSEKWQIAIWQQLQVDSVVSPHRGVLIGQLIETLKNTKKLSSQLPGRVSVFGLHSMPPLFLEALSGLALHTQVHLYLLSPCELYWGNLDTRRRRIGRQIKALKKSEQVKTVGEPVHPLLETLGRQGSEFQEMLLEQIDFELEFKSFEVPLNDSIPLLLHRIQADLLAGQIQPVEQRGKAVIQDDSLLIISAHSKVREMMILKDHILDWLHTDHELEPRDIVVMAPDISEYSSLIPSIFEELPHSVGDRTMEIRNPFVGVFLDFLEKMDGHFGWSELLDLLFQPSVYPRFDLTPVDFDLLRHWIVDAGIRWGLSGEQRAEMGLPSFVETSWRSGLDRLLMGYAIDADQPVDGILPYRDIEGSSALPLGGLCQFIDLIDQARIDFSTPRPLADWSRLLRGYAEYLFFPLDDPEFVELSGVINELENYSFFHQEPLELAVIKQWLLATAAGFQPSGGFLSGGITFCSMLPMRSIPFKCICLIGLDNGMFPAQDFYSTFDLMGESHRPGDRSKRGDDRYQFLEAILAARRRLYLSYIGQSEKTNEPIPPSVVITELLELLKYNYGIDNLTQKHPLQPFHSTYFTEKNELVSYSELYCRVAEKLSRSKQHGESWWTGELVDEPDQTVQLSSLFSYLSNPQKWFVRERLSIRLEKEFKEVKELESYKPVGLDNYLVDQEIISDLLSGRREEESLSRLQINGCWPLGSPGRLAFSGKTTELKPFVKRIGSVATGGRRPDLRVDLTCGAWRITGSLTDQYDNGMVVYRYAKCKAGDILRGYLCFLLRSEILPEPGDVHVITKDNWICFSHNKKAPISLEDLLELYRRGWHRPIELFVELGWSFIQKRARGITPDEAVKKVRNSFDELVGETDFGSSIREPEWQLLFSGLSSKEVISKEFQHYTETILAEIFSFAYSPEKGKSFLS